MVTKWVVDSSESGKSLQQFVKEHSDPPLSAKAAKKLLDNGKCRLNDRIERFGTRRVGTGDSVAVQTGTSSEQQPRKGLDTVLDQVLYQDDHLLALNKPSGITSDNLNLKKALEDAYGPLYLAHRLDKETSGVLLLARSKDMLGEIEKLFRQRKVGKLYYAIADGKLPCSSGTIDAPLEPLHRYQGQTLWGISKSPKGLKAITNYNVLAASAEATLVECRPETGRTHQIRVHLQSLGHAILGDHQYLRVQTCTFHPERLLLHAYSLTLHFFSSKAPMHIVAPLPVDFVHCVDRLFPEVKELMGEIFTK